jgi:hypothetical protein
MITKIYGRQAGRATGLDFGNKAPGRRGSPRQESCSFVLSHNLKKNLLHSIGVPALLSVELAASRRPEAQVDRFFDGLVTDDALTVFFQSLP